jgi:hypothetical protein
MVATVWTVKTLRPAPAKKGFTALFLGAILLQELRDTHAFLKLHLISGHLETPVFQGSFNLR